MHDEQGYQEPGYTVEFAGETTVQLAKHGANNWLCGISQGYAAMFYIEFGSPIWVIDDIIYYIRYQECIAIFLGRVFDRQVSFLEIA